MKYIVFKGIDRKGNKLQVTTKCTHKHIKRAYKRFLIKPSYFCIVAQKRLNYYLQNMFIPLI